MNKQQLQSHGGRFTSLLFRDGNKTRAYCAKIIKITDQTITFRDRNSGEVVLKKISSLVEYEK